MSSNYPKLSEGSISKLMNNEKILSPILQIMLYKEMVSKDNNTTNNQIKYRFILNDGIDSGNNFLIINPNLIEMIKRGELERFSCIQLNDYTITSQTAIDKRIIIIQDLTVVMPGSRIGKKIEKSPTNAGFLSTDGSNNNNLYNNTIESFASNQSLSVGSNSNANSSASRPTVGTSKPLVRSNVCPINAITPYYNAWLIRVRVTSKSNLRKYSNARGDGSVFSFDTIDETGEIRVNAFNKECEKFYNLIEVNKVYYITKGMVKTANKKFSTLQNDYEITLTQDSVIELCEESNEPLPQMRYKFVLIKDLENISQQSIVDVIGICKAVDECVTVTSKKTNKELKKRDVHLFDKSLSEVRFTLWNEMAEQFDCPINSVIAIKGAMVGEFNGKTLSALNNTTIHIDPDIPETNLLRNWFIREGQSQATIPLSKSGTDNSANEWKFLCQLNQQSENRYYSNVRARVTAIGRNPLYKACGFNGCLKKVRENSDGTYVCDKCQKESTEFEWRIILSVCLSDCTSEKWVTLFQEQAEKLLSTTSQELGILQLNDQQDYQKVLASSDFKQFVFRIGTRTESFQDETRVKSVAYNFQPVEPVKHAKRMLQNIKAWSNQ